MPGDISQQIQQLYYGHQCHPGCTHTITLADDGEMDTILKDFAQALHSGELNGKQIHTGLYAETARKLSAAITKGMGKVSFGFNDPNNTLRATLLSNVHAFSGAKSLTENAVFSELLFDDNGELKPFKKYLQDVQEINKLYNEKYLSAEYGNAVAQSQTAILWNQYNDDDWLEYNTAGDERVRDSHRRMDGITMQKKSAWWNTHWPPLDYGCRCTVVPGIKPAKPLTDSEAGKISKGSIGGPEFEFNSGQSGIAFNDKHPYFKSHKGIKQLDAVKNYGLQEVSKILKSDSLPVSLHVDSETDYYAWWDAMIKKQGVNSTDFVVKDKLGINVLFDASPNGKNITKYFKNHILNNTDNRHEFAANIEDILKNADEVWNNVDGWFYMKYYSSGLYVVVADIVDGIMKAETMYLVKPENYIKLRKGVLLK